MIFDAIMWHHFNNSPPGIHIVNKGRHVGIVKRVEVNSDHLNRSNPNSYDPFESVSLKVWTRNEVVQSNREFSL